MTETDETKPWRAEFPHECLYCEDCGTETVAAAHAAELLAMRCNEELDEARAELAEWKAKASPHCLDCREYQRACEITGNYEALEAELANLETALRLATEAAEAQRVYAGVAEARIAELEAAQQWRPMETAPKDAPIQILQRYGTGYIAESAEWNEYAWVTTKGSILPEYRCLGYMLFPEPPKEWT